MILGEIKVMRRTLTALLNRSSHKGFKVYYLVRGIIIRNSQLYKLHSSQVIIKIIGLSHTMLLNLRLTRLILYSSSLPVKNLVILTNRISLLVVWER